MAPQEFFLKLQIESLHEGGFLATSPELPGLVAQGKTRAETFFFTGVSDLRSVSLRRSAYRKHRSFAVFTFNGELAAHQFAKLARECEAQSRAAVFLRCARVRLRERLEKFRELFRRHADASVGDWKMRVESCASKVWGARVWSPGFSQALAVGRRQIRT